MPSSEVQLIQDSMTVKCELVIFMTKGETTQQILNRKNDFIKHINRHIARLGLIREVGDVKIPT